MRGHIIIALINVPIIRRPFRRSVVKMGFHILAHRRIGILIDGETGRSMLYK
ncbi:Uncharacterised protein [Vibrio cholerae]|nr:Uncharacterised protein [Vibrio cholerae]